MLVIMIFNFLVLIQRSFRPISLTAPTYEATFNFVCSPSISLPTAITAVIHPVAPARSFVHVVALADVVIVVVVILPAFLD